MALHLSSLNQYGLLIITPRFGDKKGLEMVQGLGEGTEKSCSGLSISQLPRNFLYKPATDTLFTLKHFGIFGNRFPGYSELLKCLSAVVLVLVLLIVGVLAFKLP